MRARPWAWSCSAPRRAVSALRRAGHGGGGGACGPRLRGDARPGRHGRPPGAQRGPGDPGARSRRGRADDPLARGWVSGVGGGGGPRRGRGGRAEAMAWSPFRSSLGPSPVQRVGERLQLVCARGLAHGRHTNRGHTPGSARAETVPGGFGPTPAPRYSEGARSGRRPGRAPSWRVFKGDSAREGPPYAGLPPPGPGPSRPGVPCGGGKRPRCREVLAPGGRLHRAGASLLGRCR